MNQLEQKYKELNPMALKVVATSMWQKPEEFLVKNSAEALRLKRELRDQQYHVDIEKL